MSRPLALGLLGHRDEGSGRQVMHLAFSHGRFGTNSLKLCQPRSTTSSKPETEGQDESHRQQDEDPRADQDGGHRLNPVMVSAMISALPILASSVKSFRSSATKASPSASTALQRASSA